MTPRVNRTRPLRAVARSSRVNRAELRSTATWCASVACCFYVVHEAPVPWPMPVVEAMAAAFLETHLHALWTLAAAARHRKLARHIAAPQGAAQLGLVTWTDGTHTSTDARYGDAAGWYPADEARSV